MDIRQLSYFNEIVKHGSFTIAAEALHITQPTISKAIKNMEEEIGEVVFVRDGKHIRLTDVGEVILKHANPIITQFEQLSLELADMTYLNSGKLTIGLPPMAGARFFPSVIKQFYEKYPGITINVVEAGAAKIEQAIIKGELDAGVILWPIDENIYHHFPLATEKLKVIVHPDHPLAQSDQVKLEQLEPESFIMFNQEFALHDHILEACIAKGYKPKIIAESTQWDFIGQMVAANLGIAMLPQSISKLLDKNQVKAVDLIEPTIHWQLVMAWKKDSYMSLAARAWIKFTEELFQ